MLDSIRLSRVPNISVSLVLMATLGQVPRDEKAILGSIAKTGRLVVVDESRDRCGLGSHVAAIAADKGFSSLKAPIKRVNIANVAIPYAPAAEVAVVPDAHKIGAAVLSILRH
jgi:acetoin:2,6-dichlorophenolindophenol oxidoreductase subunit beta